MILENWLVPKHTFHGGFGETVIEHILQWAQLQAKLGNHTATAAAVK